MLAGDDSFVELRKRRPEHRTLRALEAKSKAFVEQSETDEKTAEEDAKQQREIAQQRLNTEVDKVRNSKEYDERTKAIMLGNLEEVENRRLDVVKATIEDQKRQKILDSKGQKERAIQRIENRIRLMAIVLPPLPALLLGCLVYGRGSHERTVEPTRIGWRE